MEWGQPHNFYWLWAVALVALSVAAGEVARRRSLRRFADPQMLARLSHGRPRRGVSRALIRTGVLMLLVVALADPRWGRQQRRVPVLPAQVVFLVDVSRSMLAEDATPTRLDQARRAVTEMVETLSGQRAGLVLFAGQARQVVPLTRNYDDLHHRLSQLGPSSVPLDGSRLAEALSVASDAFLHDRPGPKLVVLLSDGEDHASDPLAVARTLRDQYEIRMMAVGVGDAEVGARIPVDVAADGKRAYLRHEGQVVWSRMNPQLLEKMAQQTDGAFVPFEKKSQDLTDTFAHLIMPPGAEKMEQKRIAMSVPRYRWFVGMAIVLLLLEAWPLVRLFFRPVQLSQEAAAQPQDSTSRRATGQAQPPNAETARLPLSGKSSMRPHSVPAVAVLLLGVFATPLGTIAPSDLMQRASAAYHAGHLDDALELYRRAADYLPDRAEPIFNQGVVYYRQGKWDLASERFRRVLASSRDSLAAKAHYNLGNCQVARTRAERVNRDQALARLQQAISHYRDALRQRPGWHEARANIQLVAMLIDQVAKAPEAGGTKATSDDEQSADTTSSPAETSQGEGTDSRDPEDDAMVSSSPRDNDRQEPPSPESDGGRSSSSEDVDDQQADAGQNNLPKRGSASDDEESDDEESPSGDSDQVGANDSSPPQSPADASRGGRAEDGSKGRSPRPAGSGASTATDISSDAAPNSGPAGEPPPTLGPEQVERMLQAIRRRHRQSQPEDKPPPVSGPSQFEKNW